MSDKPLRQKSVRGGVTKLAVDPDTGGAGGSGGPKGDRAGKIPKRHAPAKKSATDPGRPGTDPKPKGDRRKKVPKTAAAAAKRVKRP